MVVWQVIATPEDHLADKRRNLAHNTCSPQATTMDKKHITTEAAFPDRLNLPSSAYHVQNGEDMNLQLINKVRMCFSGCCEQAPY